MTFLSDLLAGPDPLAERVSVSLMTTYACQFSCAYCQVLRRGVHTTKKVIDETISFLERSDSKKLELKFFGGEPLLKFDLVRYAVREAQKRLGAKKDLQYCLVTNGLSLDAAKIRFLEKLPFLVVFSFDGDALTHTAFRADAAGRPRHRTITGNLKRLINSKTDFFANIVVSPENLPALPRNLRHISGLGVTRMQLCYNGAVFWSGPDIMLLVKTIADFLNNPAGKHISFLNAAGESEPVALKTDMITDTDGRVYMDGAIFMEKRFPGARKCFLIGKIEELGKPEKVYAGRGEHLRRWLNAFTCAEEEKIFMSTLKAGAALRRLFSGPGKGMNAHRTSAP